MKRNVAGEGTLLNEICPEEMNKAQINANEPANSNGVCKGFGTVDLWNIYKQQRTSVQMKRRLHGDML
jgi:hypothetical protein